MSEYLIKKIKTPLSSQWINNNYNPTVLDQITNELNYSITKQVDDALIEGLKRKGFEFENTNELKEFIKKSCRCEDNTFIKERVYFVSDTPFMIHLYGCNLDINHFVYGTQPKIKIDAGSFIYV